MRLYILLLICIFANLFSCNLLGVELSNEVTFEILYEAKYDREIEQVVFDSYEENGSIKYYPKIVVFIERDTITIYRHHEDTRIAKKRMFETRNKEVRVLSPRGITKVTMRGFESNFFAGGRVLISKNGNFFVIRQGVQREGLSRLEHLYFSLKESRALKPDERYELLRNRFEAEYGELVKPSFNLYNDKGEILWHKDPSKFPNSIVLYCSPADGKTVFGSDMGQVFTLFDHSGNRKEFLTSKLSEYIMMHLSFAKDWKYVALGFQRHPLYRYKELPGKSSEPGVALLDSNWNVLWEKPLEGYLMDWVIISPEGSYIGAGTHTMKGTGRKGERWEGGPLAQSGGFLFNKEGNFVMSVPWEGYHGEKVHSFSENERYLACPTRNQMIIIDLSEKIVLYEKEFTSPIVTVLTSNAGKIALVTRERKTIEYSSGGRPTAWKFYINVYVVNKAGEIIWESEVLEGKSKIRQGPSMISVDLLDWDKSNPIIGIVDKENGEIKIGKVLIEEEEK